MKALFDAWLSKPPVLNGDRLLPFTLGHWLILQSLDNSWLPDFTGKRNIADLVVFFEVCRRKFTAAREWVWSIDEPQMKQSAEALAVAFPNLEDAAHFAGEYLRYSCAAPDFWRSKNDATSKCPPVLHVHVALLRLGLTVEQAWNTPMGQAIWLMTAASERAEKIKTDAEIAALSECKKQAKGK